jgi:hypothetical protein
VRPDVQREQKAVAKRRKKDGVGEVEVVRIEPQPDRELQQQWAGLFVPYIYCPGCKHVYSPDELNRFDKDDPLPLPALDEEGKPEGAVDLKIGCLRCRRSRLVRVLVDFGAIEPYRVGGERARAVGLELYFCICPLCGGACQVRRSRGLRMGEDWYCNTCQLSLQRRWG